MIALWRFRYVVVALGVVVATLFGVSRLWHDITRIEEELPQNSMKERDFTTLLLDLDRLTTALTLDISVPSPEHREAVVFALDAAIVRQRDNKALYAVDEHIGPLHERIEMALSGLDAALRDPSPPPARLQDSLDAVRQVRTEIRHKTDAVFQISMAQVSAQRSDLKDLQRTMSVLIVLFGGLGLVLVVLSLGQQGSIQTLRKRDRELFTAKSKAEADSRLRMAISALQSEFIAAEDQRDRFRLFLDSCLDLTGSPYGFVGVVEAPAGAPPVLRITAACRSLSCDCTGEVLPLPAEPISAMTLTIPAGHPPITDSLVLPIICDGAMVAVVVLANRPEGYGPEVMEYLQPLLGACGNIISASRARQGEHELLKRLEAQSEALARSNSDLETFAYAVSHDLREPLRMVSSFMQLLDRRVGATLDQDARDFIRFARDGAQRMDGMTLSLLAYSRVGRKGEPMEWCDSRACLDEALGFLDVARTESGAEITIADDPSLGGWPQVYASADELSRLFLNLVGNALKFCLPSIRPHIAITVGPHDHSWCFTVQDNGIGIDPAHIGGLFTVFRRLVSHSDYPGSGIGLALCRRIVERHGGTIWAESAGCGQGTTIRFTLPTEPADGVKEKGGERL